jgi:NAD(P)-dependent dehydrogenase (short-subunit alcohol dehydrogenase family)
VFQEGEVAIITGIGPGMGRSIALAFARHGVDVALAARRPERIEPVAEEVRALGRTALVVPTDITDWDACARLVDAVESHFHRIHILVQNGHHQGDWKPVAEADPDEWRRIFDVNFFGSLYLVKLVVPVMRKGGGGRIILVNSGAVLRSPSHMGAYSASKSALASMVRTLAQEVGPDRIRVNGVFLGPVAGENLFGSAEEAVARSGGTLDDWIALKSKELPLGWIPTPDQCAGSVLFLASDLAEVVTGQHLVVNGGQW